MSNEPIIKVLNFIGISDDNQVSVTDNPKLIQSELRIMFKGNTSIFEKMKSKRVMLLDLIIGASREEARLQAPKPDIIFNSICDPDVSKNALTILENFIKDKDVPVLNPPSLIRKTTRDGIYDMFRDQDWIKIPKTIKIYPKSLSETETSLNEHDLQPPFLFREAGEHGRKLSHISDEGTLHPLEQFAFDGRPYYVTEFVDYRSDDGLYRKARFLIVDGKPYPRHLIVSNGWNIHASSRNDLMKSDFVYQREEKKFIRAVDPEIDRICRRIHENVKLDYFGIDCTIDKSGKMTIFEINACVRPLGGTQFDYLQQSNASIMKAIEEMILRRAASTQPPSSTI